MIYLENPPRKKARAKKRKPPGRFKTWAAWSKALRAKKRKGNPQKKRASSRKRPARKRAARKTTRKTGARKVATRKKKTTTRRRRTYRRNPKLTMKRLVKNTTDGAVNAALVTGGELASRVIPAQVEKARIEGGKEPFDEWTMIGFQALAAILAGAAADMFMPARRAEMVLAGALAAPLKSAIVAFDVPVVSEQLSGVGAYARIRSGGNGARRLGSYARPRALGSYARAVDGPMGMIPQDYITGPPGYPTSGPAGLAGAEYSQYDGYYGDI